MAAGLAGAAALLVLGLCAPRAASPNDQAVAYQLSPSHDGHMADAGLPTPLEQAWSVTLPGASSYPLIANGMVFVTAGDGKLYALNQATGATVWSRDVGWINQGPTYEAGIVFVSTHGADVIAFDAATGATRWTKHLGIEYAANGAPTAAGGLVYPSGSSYQNLYALRGTDGRLVWKQRVLLGGATARLPSMTMAAACTPPMPASRPTVRAPHRDRAVAPPRTVLGGGGTTPVVAGGKVFVWAHEGGSHVILSAATGVELGAVDSDATPAVEGDVAYALSDSTLRAVADSGLGATAWSFTGDGHLSTAPIVVDDVVFVGSLSGELYALASADGSTLWSTNVGGSHVAPLAVLGAANGTLIVPAGDTLVAYRTAGTTAAAPANTSSPGVDGIARVGQVLVADVGVWSGLPSAYAYQWRLCDGAGANCVDASGETGASFAPAAGAIGSTVRVRVVATNAIGSSTAVASAPTAVVAAPTPASQVAPSIPGDAREGQTLTANPGTFSGNPASFAYQWLRCETGPFMECTDIAGQTQQSHVVTTADIGNRLMIRVTATNASGDSDPTDSPRTAVVVPRVPVNQSLPTIHGTPNPGQHLFVDAGAWSPDPTGYAIRWRRCNGSGPLACSDIAGATTAAYQLVSGDVGHRFVARVVASNAGGGLCAGQSLPTAAVVAIVPVNVTLPTFAGVPDEGQYLSANYGTWTNSPERYTYQWFTCDPEGNACPDVPGATSSGYLVGSADIGRYVGVEVVAYNANGASEPAASDAYGPVFAAVPMNVAYPSIGGRAQDGQTLAADPGHWIYGPTGYRYQWYSCDAEVTACGPVAGATAATYVLGSSMVGRRIGLGVIASNAAGDSYEELSYLTDPVAALPAVAVPPIISIPVAKPPITSIPVAKPDSAISALKIRARSDGSLAVSARVRNRGKLTTVASVSAATLSSRCKRPCSRAVYGRRSATVAKAGAAAVVIKPTARGRRALARNRTIGVRVDVTFQLGTRRRAGEAASHAALRRKRAARARRAVTTRAARQQLLRLPAPRRATG